MLTSYAANEGRWAALPPVTQERDELRLMDIALPIAELGRASLQPLAPPRCWAQPCRADEAALIREAARESYFQERRSGRPFQRKTDVIHPHSARQHAHAPYVRWPQADMLSALGQKRS